MARWCGAVAWWNMAMVVWMVHGAACNAMYGMLYCVCMAGMRDVVVYNVEQTCWRRGWDIYNYFAVEGPVSRYGCWGAAEDWKDQPR